MSIAVTCPKCSASFKAKDEHAGKKAKCPKCGGPIVVPSQFHGGDTIRMPPPGRSKPKSAEDDSQ